jgi:hypothetical protein
VTQISLPGHTTGNTGRNAMIADLQVEILTADYWQKTPQKASLTPFPSENLRTISPRRFSDSCLRATKIYLLRSHGQNIPRIVLIIGWLPGLTLNMVNLNFERN